MSDDTSEVPEEVQLIVDKSVEITAILSSIENPIVASKIMAIAIAHILCHRISSENSAHEMFNMIIDDVDMVVVTTKKFGNTSWIEGTQH